MRWGDTLGGPGVYDQRAKVNGCLCVFQSCPSVYCLHSLSHENENTHRTTQARPTCHVLMPLPSPPETQLRREGARREKPWPWPSHTLAFGGRVWLWVQIKLEVTEARPGCHATAEMAQPRGAVWLDMIP